MKIGTTLTVTLLCLMLAVFVSTGVVLISGIVMIKDLLVIIILLTLYAIYAILYVLYGPVVNFFMALIYLISLIYVCKRSALIISKMTSAIYDMEHSGHVNANELAIPTRKLEVIYWFRAHSLILFTVLIGGNLVGIALFASYSWIPELYNQSIEVFYLLSLLYLFRCTAANDILYNEVQIKCLISPRCQTYSRTCV